MSITTKLVISQSETDLISTQTEKAVNPTVLYNGPVKRTLVAATELVLTVPVGAYGLVLTNWDNGGDMFVYGVTGGQASGVNLPGWTNTYLPFVLPLFGVATVYLYSAAGGTVVARFI